MVIALELLQGVIAGLLAALLYDLAKAIIKRFRR
jgi:riboflavin transporter FmnP